MARKMIVSGLFLSFLVLAAQTVEDLGLSLEQLEDKLFFLVNHERSSRGLPALSPDALLRAMARAHCQKMIQERQLAHDFPGYSTLADRAARSGLYFSSVGENVASGDTFVMRFFHEQLMASPGHRENLLSDHFRQMGIGIGKNGNMYYVTQEFANLFTPLAGSEMEMEMEKKLEGQWDRKVELLPAAASAMREFCRRMSQLFLHDQSPKVIANSYGLASILNFDFADQETGFDRITAETKMSKPIYWSLGVTFGRSAKNPGGVYALSLMAFPDLRDAWHMAGGLDDVILEALNKVRSSHDLLNMIKFPKLANPAADIARIFYESPDSAELIRQKDRYKLITAYQTCTLDVIPADVAQKIAGDSKIRWIGIHVFYPLAGGLPGNYFIVAILGI
jgi:hypothetical protein